MSVVGEVLNSLRGMSQLQLLLAFIACTGYALGQGALLAPRVRRLAGSTALAAAGGFVVEADEWTRGAMLLAFAVAGLGLFAAAVWVLSRLLGVTASSPIPARARVGEAEADVPMAPSAVAPSDMPRRTPQHKGTAHSH